MDKNPTKPVGLTLEPSNPIKPDWDNYLQKIIKKRYEKTHLYI